VSSSNILRSRGASAARQTRTMLSTFKGLSVEASKPNFNQPELLDRLKQRLSLKGLLCEAAKSIATDDCSPGCTCGIRCFRSLRLGNPEDATVDANVEAMDGAALAQARGQPDVGAVVKRAARKGRMVLRGSRVPRSLSTQRRVMPTDWMSESKVDRREAKGLVLTPIYIRRKWRAGDGFVHSHRL
jgi:hypothetical protein